MLVWIRLRLTCRLARNRGLDGAAELVGGVPEGFFEVLLLFRGGLFLGWHAVVGGVR